MDKKIFVTIIALATVGICAWLCYAKDPHDTPPKTDTRLDKGLPKNLADLQSSPYFQSLQPLHKFVEGRTVLRSEVGNAGFVLLFDNNTWAAAYRDGSSVGSLFGQGKPDSKALSQINSSKYGDASEPLKVNLPYANQRCDMRAQIKKSHGKIIVGLSYGEHSFNFAFDGNRELDLQLVDDSKGRPAVRVFWEQW